MAENNKVGIIMGSDSDLRVMQAAADQLLAAPDDRLVHEAGPLAVPGVPFDVGGDRRADVELEAPAAVSHRLGAPHRQGADFGQTGVEAHPDLLRRRRHCLCR